MQRKKQFNPEDLLTTTEAANFLTNNLNYPITPNTMNIWRSQKRGPKYYKSKNRRIFYKVEDLIKFVEAKTNLQMEAVNTEEAKLFDKIDYILTNQQINQQIEEWEED